MDSVVTSLHGLLVKISWLSTTEENGSAITAYEVKIQTSQAGVYVTDSICDGSKSVTMDQTYCLIPMEHFTEEPYLLSQGDLIVATVSAYNAVGWSEKSADNTDG